MSICILTNNHFDKFITQRNKLFYLALKNNKSSNKDNSRISCIIFSRDRGMQLFALLESMKMRISNIQKIDVYVLYSTSTEAHNSIYEEVVNEKMGLNANYFKHLGNNSSILKGLMSEIKTEKVFFLCDDDIFINNLDINQVIDIDAERYILSLRHHINLKFCYLNGKYLNIPPLKKFNSMMYSYIWTDDDTEWGDIMSVNGQVYLVEEIALLTSICDFSAPNSYELELKLFKSIFSNRHGLCYEQACILNLPINQVQIETKVVHGNINVNFLMEKWNEGLKLDINMLNATSSDSFYKNLDLNFTDR